MPQLVPIFFVDQLSFRFICFMIIKIIIDKLLDILVDIIIYIFGENPGKCFLKLFELFFYLTMFILPTMLNNKVTQNGTTLVLDLLDGTIHRTPLLQGGQSMGDLVHTWHPVTGGHIAVGTTDKGYVPRILGMCINSFSSLPDFEYNPRNEAINKQFACILFEMKEAGQKSLSKSCLDYISVTPGEKGMYHHYLNSYLDTFEPNRNKTHPPFISDKLINDLGSSREV